MKIFHRMKNALQYVTTAAHTSRKAILHCASVVRRKGNITLELRMLMIQLAGAFAVLYGISYWSVACALIVGGIGAIAAIEMQGRASEPEETPEQEQAVRAQIDAALGRGRNPFDSQLVPMTPKWLTYVALVRRTKAAE